MKIGDEVYIHGYVDEIRNDMVIIRNEGGYFGTVLSEIKPSDSEKPNNCETCKHYHPDHEAIACERCLDGKYSRYEPKTEPQTLHIDKPRGYTLKADTNDAWKSQTMYYPQVDGITPSVIVPKDEPQTERSE